MTAWHTSTVSDTVICTERRCSFRYRWFGISTRICCHRNDWLCLMTSSRAFARFRARQHRLALRMLELFEHHDVSTADGHAMILAELATTGSVSQFMGVSSYVRQKGRYILPWPTD